jgi:hypothetical protein
MSLSKKLVCFFVRKGLMKDIKIEQEFYWKKSYHFKTIHNTEENLIINAAKKNCIYRYNERILNVSVYIKTNK